MAAISGTGEFGKRFAKLFGLDPSKTRKLVLTVEADSAIMLDVEMYVEEKDFDNVEREINQLHFELKEVDV